MESDEGEGNVNWDQGEFFNEGRLTRDSGFNVNGSSLIKTKVQSRYCFLRVHLGPQVQRVVLLSGWAVPTHHPQITFNYSDLKQTGEGLRKCGCHCIDHSSPVSVIGLF